MPDGVKGDHQELKVKIQKSKFKSQKSKKTKDKRNSILIRRRRTDF